MFSELEVENRRGTYLGSEAALASALARAEQARIAHEAEIDGVNPTVARLQAELRQAEFDLEETTVRAPTDGYVTQLFLRPGMIAVPLPLRPVMVFIHSEDNEFAAAFQQNALQRVRAGDEAEIAFDAVPGRVFRGKVTGIMDAVAQGQLQPTGRHPRIPRRRIGWARVAPSPTSTSSTISPPISFRRARRRRWPCTPSTGTTSPSSGASCCA